MDLSSLPKGATHLLTIKCDSKAEDEKIRDAINMIPFAFVFNKDDSPITLKWTHLQDNTYSTTSRLADNFITADTRSILRGTKVSCVFFIQRIMSRGTIGNTP